MVPNEVWLGGTVRTFAVETLDLIERRMKAIADATGAAHECEVLVEFQRKYPPTVNDPEQTRFAVSVMEEVVGKENVDASVEPTMTGEDFSFMLLAKPGCFAFLGNGDGAHRDAARDGTVHAP